MREDTPPGFLFNVALVVSIAIAGEVLVTKVFHLFASVDTMHLLIGALVAALLFAAVRALVARGRLV